MRKLQWILAAVLGAAFMSAPVALSGCTGTTTRGQIRVVASTPPPPPRRVVVVDRRPGYVWVPGHWQRYDSDWVWRSGYWTRARPGYDYVPGYWVQRAGRYYWVEPRWRRVSRTPQRTEQRREPPARDVEIRDQRTREREPRPRERH